MEELKQQMKVLLANVYATGLKAQYYHWNVTGPMFPMWHEFFGEFYEELHGSIDQIAEEIRTLDTFSPGSFGRFRELATVSDEERININPIEMVKQLSADNNTIISNLMKCNELSEDFKIIGLANFLQDRIDKHHKHKWMLESIQKG
jgi:starvation-inducible DNA-binding protein